MSTNLLVLEREISRRQWRIKRFRRGPALFATLDETVSAL